MASLQTSPFSATSSWNTPVPSNSTFTKLNWPSSTGYNYSVAWDAYSPSVYVASPSDPIVQVSHPAGWGYPAGTVSVHMPAAANGAAGTDGELIVIDGDVAYNFWQFNRTSTTTASAASFGAENVVTGDGWGSKAPFLSAGITAVGSSMLGGLLVKAETDDGSIDHALQIAIDSKLAMSGFVGDAIAGDGGSSSGIVKEGQLLAITPNTPMPAGLSPLGQEVFTAMQKYGAYVIDVAGGVTNIRAQANAYDAATMTALWHDMGKITPLLQSVTVPSTPGGGGPTGGTSSTDAVGSTDTRLTTPPVTAPIVDTVAASSAAGADPVVTTASTNALGNSLSTASAPDVSSPSTQTVSDSSSGTSSTGTTSSTDALDSTDTTVTTPPVTAPIVDTAAATDPDETTASTNALENSLVPAGDQAHSPAADALEGGLRGASTAPSMALFNQYAASSFVSSGPGLVGGPMQCASAELVQTLAKPHG